MSFTGYDNERGGNPRGGAAQPQQSPIAQHHAALFSQAMEHIKNDEGLMNHLLDTSPHSPYNQDKYRGMTNNSPEMSQ